MTDEGDFITVFRSGDPTARKDAEEACDRLTKAGIRSVLLGDDSPGVVEGSWEVRVPTEDRERAEALVDAPAPEEEDEEEVREEGLSHDLDFVTVATFDGAGGEMQATLLKAALEGYDIPSTVVGLSQIPSLAVEVRVPKTRLKEAMTVVAAANQPDAAQSGAEVESGE
jgi:hypothetical protein